MQWFCLCGRIRYPIYCSYGLKNKIKAKQFLSDSVFHKLYIDRKFVVVALKTARLQFFPEGHPMRVYGNLTNSGKWRETDHMSYLMIFVYIYEDILRENYLVADYFCLHLGCFIMKFYEKKLKYI